MLNLKHSIVFLVMLYLGSSAANDDELWITREEILASHKARGEQLEILLTDAKNRVADHYSGTRLLAEDELAQLERKVEVFTLKLEKMRSIPDEQEVERILAREREIKKRNDERRKAREEL